MHAPLRFLYPNFTMQLEENEGKRGGTLLNEDLNPPPKKLIMRWNLER